MFSNLSLREKILLIIAGIFIILIVYYFFLYQPLQEEIVVLENKIVEQNQTLMSTQILARQLPSLQEEYETLKQQREIRLKEEKKWSLAEILAEMQLLTQKYQLELLNFDPRETDTETSINFSLQGNYYNLSALLLELKAWKGFFRYTSLIIQARGDNIFVNLNINLIKVT